MGNQYENEILIASVGSKESEEEVHKLWLQRNPSGLGWSSPSYEPGDYDRRLEMRRPSGELLGSLRMTIVKTSKAGTSSPADAWTFPAGPDQLVLLTRQICGADIGVRFALWYQSLHGALFIRTNEEGFSCAWHLGVHSTMSLDLGPRDGDHLRRMKYELHNANRPSESEVISALRRDKFNASYHTRREDDVKEWLPRFTFRGKEPFQETVPSLRK